MSPEIVMGIGAAAGYAGGQIAETLAQARVARNRASVVAAGGDEFSTESAARTSFQALRSRAIAPIAIAAAVGCSLEGYALLASESVQEQQSPLKIVVDHSGGTAGEGKSAPINIINAVVAELGKTGVTSKVLVASIDEFPEVSLERVAKLQPFGDAPLDKALSFSISQSAAAPKNSGANKVTDRIVVITNGNGIGGANTIKQAQAAGVEITVVNVKPSGRTKAPIEASFKAIAKDTGGIYVPTNELGTEKAIKQVEKGLAPSKESVQAPYKPLFGAVGGLALLGAAVNYRRRRDTPLLQRNKGE